MDDRIAMAIEAVLMLKIAWFTGGAIFLAGVALLWRARPDRQLAEDGGERPPVRKQD